MRAQPSYWIKTDTHKAPQLKNLAGQVVMSPWSEQDAVTQGWMGSGGTAATGIIVNKEVAATSVPGLTSVLPGRACGAREGWGLRLSRGPEVPWQLQGAPSCSEPGVLHQPHLGHPLPNASPTRHRPRSWWPWRILALQTTLKPSLGRPDIQDSREVLGVCPPGSAGLGCSQGRLLCQERRGPLWQ